MKTQTPQKKKWLFSLMVLPIIALLFYSFSARKIVKINKNTENISVNTQNENEKLNRYTKLSKNYSKAIELYLNGPQIDNSQLIILKGELDRIYKSFSETEISLNSIKTAPPVPAKYLTPRNHQQQNLPTAKEITSYNNWAKMMKEKFTKMPESEKIEGYPHIINDKTFRYHKAIYTRMSETQKKNAQTLPEAILVTEWPMPTGKMVNKISIQKNPPTKKEIEDYNNWAKRIKLKINAAIEDKTKQYPIIKSKEVLKYKSILDRMTKDQKTNAEEFPNIPPPPPPPPTKAKPNKHGKKKTLKEIIKETPKGVESGFEVLDNGESHYYTVYKGKKTYYNKDGYITDNKGNILPPPPPAPPAPSIPNKSKDKS